MFVPPQPPFLLEMLPDALPPIVDEKKDEKKNEKGEYARKVPNLPIK